MNAAVKNKWRLAQFFEILWWKRFLKDKSIEEYRTYKLLYWEDFLRKSQLDILPGMQVLDAGCGPAGIFMALKDVSITAFDPLLDKYESSIDHFKSSDWPHVRFFQSMLENFDAKEKYDITFCINAINHVSDLTKSIQVLVDGTKHKGKLVVSIDAHNHGVLKTIFRAIPGDVLHPHQLSLEDYVQMFVERGCKLDRTMVLKSEFIFNYYLLVLTKN
ncbi:MAG: methyltransferase domain-containing protein [Sphingobacteriia bacterium]|nr:MAG: methyltransferase domain-containing protein [Sphingobacteriia bacterium]